MSVDMINETYQEYRDRLSAMSDERLQRIIDYYSEPGYNCEGLVLNDKFINPRWKVAEDILKERKNNSK